MEVIFFMINSTRYAAAARKNLGYSLKLARAGSSLLQKDAAELSGVARLGCLPCGKPNFN